MGIDFTKGMLEIAENKSVRKRLTDRIRFIEGNALDLQFEDESFDLVTVAFGLRNLNKIDKGLKEAFRVLKPCGKFLSLEFFRADRGVSRIFSDWYIKGVIPVIGRIVSGQRGAYDYLPASRDKFITASEFDSKLEESGFTKQYLIRDNGPFSSKYKDKNKEREKYINWITEKGLNLICS